MIFLSPFLEKSHSLKDSEYQIYNVYFSLNNETLILFSRKNIYAYARDESLRLFFPFHLTYEESWRSNYESCRLGIFSSFFISNRKICLILRVK